MAQKHSFVEAFLSVEALKRGASKTSNQTRVGGGGGGGGGGEGAWSGPRESTLSKLWAILYVCGGRFAWDQKVVQNPTM